MQLKVQKPRGPKGKRKDTSTGNRELREGETNRPELHEQKRERTGGGKKRKEDEEGKKRKKMKPSRAQIRQKGKLRGVKTYSGPGDPLRKEVGGADQ